MKRPLFFLVFFFSVSSLNAQSVSNEEVMQKVSTGRPFLFVLLKAGTARPLGDSAMSVLQMNHLNHLFTMERQGKISIFGPVINDEKIKGTIVFNTTDRAAVTEDLLRDPYIKDGYLDFDIYDWFCIPGQKIPE